VGFQFANSCWVVLGSNIGFVGFMYIELENMIFLVTLIVNTTS